MAFPLIFAAKGIFFLIKAIAGKAALVKAASIILAKSIAAYGLSATVITTLKVGAVIGGVLWTEQRIKHLRKAFKALEEDNLGDAIYYFASLLKALKGVDVDGLADTVQVCLQSITSYSRAVEVHDLILELGGEIKTVAQQLK